MTKKSQKHIFINLALLIAGSFVFLGALIPLVDPGEPPQLEDGVQRELSLPVAQADSKEPQYYPLPQPQANRKPAAVRSAENKRRPVNISKKLAPQFLKQNNGDFFWQPNVIAVRDLKQAKSGKYLGAFGEFSIIDSQTPAASSLPVVWSQKYNKYGVYKGNVIVIGTSKDLQPYLQKRGLRFSQLSGSYVIPVKTLRRAFDTVKTLKRQFPKALVEMDINLQKVR